MTSLLLALILWTQGIPLQAQKTGTITGVVKDSQGKPVKDVRVAAVPRPDSIEGVTGVSAVMSSNELTDAQGRYTLENVPPGRYFVAAGRLDFPTYYPGTQAMGDARIIAVAAGVTVPNIDFAMKDTSVGRAEIGFGLVQNQFTIPLDVRVENNGKLPIFAEAQFTSVRLTPEPFTAGIAVSAPVTQPFISFAPVSSDYRVSIEGLPAGYTVKSIKYGAAELKAGLLSGLPPPQMTSLAGRVLVQMNANGIITTTTVSPASPAGPPPLPPPLPQLLSIVLTPGAAPARRTGVSIRGQLVAAAAQGVYVSGTPGTIYIDGTYEFSGVAPGRHTVIATDTRRTAKLLVALLVVGSQDMSGVDLVETPVLPAGFKKPEAPAPAVNRAAGAIPLAAVRGRVLDTENTVLVTRGDVFLVGETWFGYALSDDGKFEFENLLPGKYEIEVKAVGYPTLRQALVVEEKDIELEVKAN